MSAQKTHEDFDRSEAESYRRPTAISSNVAAFLKGNQVLSSALKRRFKDSESDGWQGYGFLGFPKPGQDPRQHCFDRMTATIDSIPHDLSTRAEQFLAISSLWFEEEMGNLCEDVGWDFFPQNAAEFVRRVLLELESKPFPDDAQLQRLERCSLQIVEDLRFSDADC